MANILFLLEGASREKKYFNVMNRIFSDRIKSKINFFYYGTNIHVLYDELKKDSSLDIIELVKEKAKKDKDDKNYKILNENKFGEIYLIFDLDPQDDNFTCNRIQEMLDLFNNETENGKLYVNYPMVESFKHFKSIPDIDYNDYKVKIDDCTKYKRNVAKISCINHFKEIDKKIFFNIVKQNVSKINLLVNDSKTYDYNTYINTLNQNNIFRIQRKEIELDNSIYVINSMCLWPLDYFNESVFKEITT